MLQLRDGGTVESSLGNPASLQGAAIEATTVVIVALADDLTTADDDCAMTIMKWRLSGLLETECKIVVGLHFD